MRRHRLNGLAIGGLIAISALTTPSQAQEASIAAFPVRQFQDENGVDLLSGLFTVLSPSLRIGGEDMGLTYFREVRGGTFRDTMMWNITVSGSTYTVALGPRSEKFTLAGGVYTPVENNGSTLTASGSAYTYTAADGTVATFLSGGPTIFFGNARGIVVQTLTYPSGRTLTFYYHEDGYPDPRNPVIVRYGRRLQGVSTNAGWQLNFQYASDTASPSTLGTWPRIVTIKGLNSAVDSCSPLAFSCPQTGRPQLNIAGGGFGSTSYTDAEGRTTLYTVTGSQVTGVQLPGSSSNDVSVTYASGRVSSITRFGVTTGYASSDASGVRTVTVTRPGGATRVVTFDIAKSVMLSDRDELIRTTSYQYDSNNRLTRTTRPEGNYTQFTYDPRGNVTETRAVSKTPGTPADIVATASYLASCTNALTCNLPTGTTDPKGNTTNYTYDATHGGVLTVTAPAPATGAIRPQTRSSYTRLNSSGAPSATGIFRPTGSSTCQTGAAPACIGTADEVKSTTAYGQGLLPSSISQGAGDNSLTATRSMTYDVAGNLLTVDGPLAGTADTTRLRYNLNREVIGVVGPDPDGAGTLKHRAQRTTYGATGLVTKTERGTVNGQSDPDWAAFASLEEVQQDYDANRRPSVQRLVSGGTTYALTQSGYDNRGRVECTATRMNPAIYGALPASACTLGTQGSFGPDRIAKTVYDAASQVTEQQVAVGTADQANDAAYTYSANGRLVTLTDAEVNKTTYEYDGHDRLNKTRMPLPTKGANASSTTDYEQSIYDDNGNILERRLRDYATDNTRHIDFTYDNLNRPTLKNLPGGEPDVTYAYDNLGRLTSATQTGNSLSFTYDALGRNLTQVGPQGTVASQWDLAGRRTKLTYPGSGLYIDYDYLVTGEMTKLRENGASSGIGVLATLAYDDLGRRNSLTRGNGTVTTYTFDPVSRLATLAENVASTANDQSVTFSYNPASQIASLTKTNDLYAWTGHGSGSTASVPNGLNQLTTIGGSATMHDARGNLTSDPTNGKGYSYSSENLLTGSTGGTAATLGYDPAMRLYQLAGTATTRFAYDGLAMIAEYNGSNALQRRFVHGPGVDEPLAWYEGIGTTDRRWMHADERGSVIAVSNASGAVTTINRYDEYGRPQTTNAGRFQYTGQTWLPEIGAYYYKARIYAPAIGRFLQTDPIGYEGGINLYGYAGSNPINFSDPSGLVQCTGSRLSFTSCEGIAGWSCTGDCAAAFGQPLPPVQTRMTPEEQASCADFICLGDSTLDFLHTDISQTLSPSASDGKFRFQGEAILGIIAPGVIEIPLGSNQIAVVTYAPNPIGGNALQNLLTTFGSVTVWTAISNRIPVNTLNRFDASTYRGHAQTTTHSISNNARYVFIIPTQTTQPRTHVRIFTR